MPLLTKAYLGSTKLWEDKAWFENTYDTFSLIDTDDATVTADAATHTKGAWVELVASSSADASLLVVTANNYQNSVNTSALLDIGIGASGSESAVISNLAFGGARDVQDARGWAIPIPLKVPSGSRISARIQSVISSRTATIGVTLFDRGDYSSAPTSVDVLGSDTAASTGTTFSGSVGTWTEVVASTSQDYRAIALAPSLNGTSSSLAVLYYVLGQGASGSEAIVGRSIVCSSNAEFIYPMVESGFPLFGKPIPAGTRLSVQTPTSTNPQNYGVTLIGIP